MQAILENITSYTYYNTKNQKSDGSFETSQKIIQKMKKSLKKQRRKRKLFTLKIITTIFNNSTFDFLCQSKKRPNTVMDTFNHVSRRFILTRIYIISYYLTVYTSIFACRAVRRRIGQYRYIFHLCF